MEWKQKWYVLILSLGLKTQDKSSLMLFFPSCKVDCGVAWPSFNDAVKNNAMVDGREVEQKAPESLDGLTVHSQSDNLDFLPCAVLVCEGVTNFGVL